MDTSNFLTTFVPKINILFTFGRRFRLNLKRPQTIELERNSSVL